MELIVVTRACDQVTTGGVDPAIYKPIKNALLINCENRQTQKRRVSRLRMPRRFGRE